MKKIAVSTALLCLVASCAGLAGCSSSGGKLDVAHMSKSQQLDAFNHPSPKTVEMVEKMRAAMHSGAAGHQAGKPPVLPMPTQTK